LIFLISFITILLRNCTANEPLPSTSRTNCICTMPNHFKSVGWPRKGAGFTNLPRQFMYAIGVLVSMVEGPNRVFLRNNPINLPRKVAMYAKDDEMCIEVDSQYPPVGFKLVAYTWVIFDKDVWLQTSVEDAWLQTQTNDWGDLSFIPLVWMHNAPIGHGCVFINTVNIRRGVRHFLCNGIEESDTTSFCITTFDNIASVVPVMVTQIPFSHVPSNLFPEVVRMVQSILERNPKANPYADMMDFIAVCLSQGCLNDDVLDALITEAQLSGPKVFTNVLSAIWQPGVDPKQTMTLFADFLNEDITTEFLGNDSVVSAIVLFLAQTLGHEYMLIVEDFCAKLIKTHGTDDYHHLYANWMLIEKRPNRQAIIEAMEKLYTMFSNAKNNRFWQLFSTLAVVASNNLFAFHALINMMCAIVENESATIVQVISSFDELYRLKVMIPGHSIRNQYAIRYLTVDRHQFGRLVELPNLVRRWDALPEEMKTETKAIWHFV
jgi:hypothetical protein